MNRRQKSILFLPGASGDPAFWQPVADLMPPDCRCTVQTYPEFAGQPPHPAVQDFAGLCDWVLANIQEPTVLVAQSMGGIIAMQAALRKPEQVCGLVLVATSGGMDVSAFGAEDWRSGYLLEQPQLPTWFVEADCDLSPDFAELQVPVLLIWGGDDPISPPAVGRFLRQALSNAELAVIPNGRHDVAHTHAVEVAARIRDYLNDAV